MPRCKLISSVPPSSFIPGLPTGSAVNRHMWTFYLACTSGEMEGSETRAVKVHREGDLTMVGQFGGWISPEEEAELGVLLDPPPLLHPGSLMDGHFEKEKPALQL